jgi:hypothetical protein
MQDGQRKTPKNLNFFIIPGGNLIHIVFYAAGIVPSIYWRSDHYRSPGFPGRSGLALLVVLAFLVVLHVAFCSFWRLSRSSFPVVWTLDGNCAKNKFKKEKWGVQCPP